MDILQCYYKNYNFYRLKLNSQIINISFLFTWKYVIRIWWEGLENAHISWTCLKMQISSYIIAVISSAGSCVIRSQAAVRHLQTKHKYSPHTHHSITTRFLLFFSSTLPFMSLDTNFSRFHLFLLLRQGHTRDSASTHGCIPKMVKTLNTHQERWAWCNHTHVSLSLLGKN